MLPSLRLAASGLTSRAIHATAVATTTATPPRSHAQLTLHQQTFASTPLLLKKAHRPTKAPNAKEASKGNKSASSIDDLLDELSDEEEDEDENKGKEEPEGFVDQSNAVAVFMHKLKQQGAKGHNKGSGGKGKSSHGVAVTYPEAKAILDVDSYWVQLEKQVEDMKHFYATHLTVRSATALDELPVLLEGDEFPLCEICSISRKDPKRIVLDCSSFPQASSDIVKAIRDSGMNLNPQQEGVRIFVPIPKVTKEYREKLSKGAKVHLTETKDSLRKVHHATAATLEAGKGVSVDQVQAIKVFLQAALDHWNALAETACHMKQKDIIGK